MRARPTRREWLHATGCGVATVAFGPGRLLRTPRTLRGRLKQSVSRWPFAGVPFDRFCSEAATMGIQAIDLLRPTDWERVREYGLVCSMGEPSDRRDFIATGFNDRRHHAMLLAELEETIPLAARHGVPNVIAMFGNRGGRADAPSAAACIEGLREIAPLAEQHRVTVCVELLNSKVDHIDYQGDRTWFGVEVIEGVGSPRVKLLYDIYHMQIMEGDVIRTIRDNSSHIAHFHTGGVPGRHELDATQELNYRAVATAIADLGFEGYLAHEFMPTGDPMVSLRQAVEICDV
jgi:hydroxypyruvate isomerase